MAGLAPRQESGVRCARSRPNSRNRGSARRYRLAKCQGSGPGVFRTQWPALQRQERPGNASPALARRGTVEERVTPISNRRLSPASSTGRSLRAPVPSARPIFLRGEVALPKTGLFFRQRSRRAALGVWPISHPAREVGFAPAPGLFPGEARARIAGQGTPVRGNRGAQALTRRQRRSPAASRNLINDVAQHAVPAMRFARVAGGGLLGYGPKTDEGGVSVWRCRARRE